MSVKENEDFFSLYELQKKTSIVLATVSFFNEIKRKKERFVGLILSKNWYNRENVSLDYFK